jgi:hypothetical protein
LKKKVFDRFGDQVIHRSDDDQRTRQKKKQVSEAKAMKIATMVGTQSKQKVSAVVFSL